jgi:hypothetical protein
MLDEVILNPILYDEPSYEGNIEFDDSGQLSTKIYDKRDDFNFKIINFPNMCSNIPGRNSANLELLIDKTSSIYLYVILKALAS